jgi:predicted amidophosphoribosyltransferase
VVRRQLGTELTRTVPISLFAPDSPLHQLLVGYKAAPSRRARDERQASLSRLLGEFLELHLPCLLGPILNDDAATLAVPVPSSSAQRPSWGGEHPLIGLIAAALVAEPGLALAPVIAKGAEPLGHLHASRRGFRLVGPVAGRRVLVLDDTYTSGARSQSAAVALARGGADVVAIVPIGRLIHPDHSPATGALWAHQQREPFDPRRCAGPCQLWPRATAVARPACSGGPLGMSLTEAADDPADGTRLPGRPRRAIPDSTRAQGAQDRGPPSRGRVAEQRPGTAA